MTDTATNRTTTENSGDETRAAIDAFLQILAVMPKDVVALDSVYNGYKILGDTGNQADFLKRLVEVHLEDEDETALRRIMPDVRQLAQTSPTIEALRQRIDEQLAAAPVAGEPVHKEEVRVSLGGQVASEQIDSTFNIATELSVAWNLLEANDLTQEEYASIVQDLTDMSVSASAETVSVLHALEARGFRGLPKIMSRLSKEFDLPVVSLRCFDVQTAVDPLLPMDFMLQRGALVFELVGDEALVAILNPCDETLRHDVKALTARECHFFLALPSEFDDALTRLSEVTAA